MDRIDSDGTGERRRHVRMPAHGSVLLRRADEIIRGRLVNISDDGIELSCQLVLASDTLAGLYDVGVRLDGNTGSWLHSLGRIVCVRATQSCIVVHFDPMSPELHAATAIVRDRNGHDAEAMSVMLADRDWQRRCSMAIAFRHRGCTVVEVASPLEAFDWLASGHSDLSLIVVGSTSPTTIGEELETYLLLAHPESVIVRLSGSDACDARFAYNHSAIGLVLDDVLLLLQAKSDGRERSGRRAT